MDQLNFIDDYIKPLLDKMQAENKKLFLSGDFNFDLLNLENNETSHFFETMMSCQLMPSIILPTKINAKKDTVIDNIFTDQINPDMKSGNLTITISDHLPSFLIMPKDNQNHIPKKQNIYIRDIRKFDKVNFTLDFLNINWKDKLDRYKKDVNKATQFFFWKMNNLLDKYMPWRKLSKKEYKRKFKPWINDDILNKIKLKNKYFRKSIKCKDPGRKEVLRDNYKSIKNEITALTRQRKKQYYQKYFTENKANLQKIWKGIKEVINVKTKIQNHPTCVSDNGTTIYESKQIATTFNNYITNIAEDILKERKYKGNTSHRKYLKNPHRKTFVAYESDATEVTNLISILKPHKGTGPNSLPTQILLMLKDEIGYPLSIIFNISVNTGTFPDLLKLSETIPIYKKGSKIETSNYRPISLLSNINKLFEKMMYNRVYSFLESNKCIYNLQFGFRSKHSTNHTLIEITEKIRCALDNHESTCGVFIDLQKAFDTVNHKILIDKLNYYGIRGVTNRWFKSYLYDRTQYVSIQGYKSDTRPIQHGVPQGSVLGPLLFLIYINDLHTAIPYSKTYHFADDTHLLNTCSSPKQLQKRTNIDLKCLYKWLMANKISLNCSKTEVIIFQSNKSNENFKYKIKINGHRIIPSDNIKYLGIYLDDNLSGQKHCKILGGKLNRANGMLCKVRHYVPKDELKSIFHAIFSSHLTYNCEIWGLSNYEHVNKIQKLQNRAMKIINCRDFNSPSKPLYISNKILKLNDVIKLRNCLFVHDFLNNLLPNCFYDYFKELNLIYTHDTRSSSLGCLYVPLVNTTTYGINSITYKSIQCWNRISRLYGINLSELSRNNLKKTLTQIFIDDLTAF